MNEELIKLENALAAYKIKKEYLERYGSDQDTMNGLILLIKETEEEINTIKHGK